MAGNPSFDEIAATTLQHYLPSLENQVFDNQPFMFWLQQSPRCVEFRGGRSLVCPLIYAETDTCITYSGYDTLPTKPQKGISAAEFFWKQAACTISLCGFEECVNEGPYELVDLLSAKIMQAQETLTANFDEMFIRSNGTGNDGKDWCGLAGLIGNRYRSPRIGGINAADPACSWWESVIHDGGLGEAIANNQPKPEPRTLTLKDMLSLFNCLVDGTDSPDLILTSKEMFESYECLLQPGMMQTNSSVGDAGFQNLMYKGITMMWDHNVPADTMYFLNSKYLRLYKKRNRWFTMSQFIEPANQDARYAKIRMFGELTICNRRRQGVLCNVKVLT